MVSNSAKIDEQVDRLESRAPEPADTNTSRRRGIQVISRAARILRALGDNSGGLSLGGLAERVGLPRSTVQRIVEALAAEGLVISASRSSPVLLGPGLLALAQRSRRDAMEIAHPLLKKLSLETGETIDLAILRGDHVVFVDQVIGAQRLRAVSAVGEHFPLHSTASGKACLALLNDTEIRSAVDGYLDNGDGPGMDAFLAEIAEVRRTGLAFDYEEHSPGISAIGAAFRDSTGDIYAVSIPAPTERARTGRERNAKLLLATCDELARLVGAPNRVA